MEKEFYWTSIKFFEFKDLVNNTKLQIGMEGGFNTAKKTKTPVRTFISISEYFNNKESSLSFILDSSKICSIIRFLKMQTGEISFVESISGTNRKLYLSYTNNKLEICITNISTNIINKVYLDKYYTEDLKNNLDNLMSTYHSTLISMDTNLQNLMLMESIKNMKNTLGSINTGILNIESKIDKPIKHTPAETSSKFIESDIDNINDIPEIHDLSIDSTNILNAFQMQFQEKLHDFSDVKLEGQENFKMSAVEETADESPFTNNKSNSTELGLRPFLGSFINWKLDRLFDWVVAFSMVDTTTDSKTFCPLNIIFDRIDKNILKQIDHREYFYKYQYYIIKMLKNGCLEYVNNNKFPIVPILDINMGHNLSDVEINIYADIVACNMVYRLYDHEISKINNIPESNIVYMHRLNHFFIKIISSSVFKSFSPEIVDKIKNKSIEVISSMEKSGIFEQLKQNYKTLTINKDLNLNISRIIKIMESYEKSINKAEFTPSCDIDKLFIRLNIMPSWEIKSAEDIKVATCKQIRINDNCEIINLTKNELSEIDDVGTFTDLHNQLFGE